MPEPACTGRTDLMFGGEWEQPEARRLRESKAVALCESCPLIDPCRIRGRSEALGVWGGLPEDAPGRPQTKRSHNNRQRREATT